MILNLILHSTVIHGIMSSTLAFPIYLLTLNHLTTSLEKILFEAMEEIGISVKCVMLTKATLETVKRRIIV
jgi:hypothetical protein